MAKRKSAFGRCVESVTATGSADDPRAVCAVAGRRKYGQAEMTRRSIAGRGNPEVWYAFDRRFQTKKQAYDYAQKAANREGHSVIVYHNDAQYGVVRPVRSNPVEEAAALSEAFHGRPAESITEYTDTLHEHTVLTDLGALLRINLDHGVKVKFPRSQTRLASNEAGTQLYSVGGDQSVDLDGFDVDETKESVVLGQVKKIVYSTAKYHLGKDDETEGPYVHELGEETGHLPLLVYDTVNRMLSFVGGSYHIDIDIDGKYSAGIRD